MVLNLLSGIYMAENMRFLKQGGKKVANTCTE